MIFSKCACVNILCVLLLLLQIENADTAATYVSNVPVLNKSSLDYTNLLTRLYHYIEYYHLHCVCVLTLCFSRVLSNEFIFGGIDYPLVRYRDMTTRP